MLIAVLDDRLYRHLQCFGNLFDLDPHLGRHTRPHARWWIVNVDKGRVLLLLDELRQLLGNGYSSTDRTVP